MELENISLWDALELLKVNSDYLFLGLCMRSDLPLSVNMDVFVIHRCTGFKGRCFKQLIFKAHCKPGYFKPMNEPNITANTSNTRKCTNRSNVETPAVGRQKIFLARGVRRWCTTYGTAGRI